MKYGQLFFWLGTVIVPFLWARQMKSAERPTKRVVVAWIPYALLVACGGWFLFDFVLFDSLFITCVISYAGVLASVMTNRLDGNRV